MTFTWSQIRENHLIYEDNMIIAINKPTGISVSNDRRDADLEKLALGDGEKLYPVHRIDKETSGLVLFAKDIQTHSELTRQFAKQTVKKSYLAMIHSGNLPDQGMIDLPLSVGRKNKVRIAGQRADILFDQKSNTWYLPEDKTFTHVKTYPSITQFKILQKDPDHTLLELNPITGRTHQIRVHLAWIDYPIIGDPLFIKKTDPSQPRMYLHSWKLSFEASWLENPLLTLIAEPDLMTE